LQCGVLSDVAFDSLKGHRSMLQKEDGDHEAFWR
jgi:hypothetical protein